MNNLSIKMWKMKYVFDETTFFEKFDTWKIENKKRISGSWKPHVIKKLLVVKKKLSSGCLHASTIHRLYFPAITKFTSLDSTKTWDILHNKLVRLKSNTTSSQQNAAHTYISLETELKNTYGLKMCSRILR